MPRRAAVKRRNSRRSQPASRNDTYNGLVIRSDALLARRPSMAGSFRFHGLPDCFKTTLRYSDSFTIGAATGGVKVQSFRANSCFDPDFTNTGHQPGFFDQFAAMYGRYVVVKARLKVQFVNTTTNVPIAIVVVAGDQDYTSTFPLNLDALRETPYNWSAIAPSLSTPPVVIDTGWVDVSKIMGQKIITSDANMYALTTTNPTDVMWFGWECQAVDNSGSTGGYAVFELEQQVIFRDMGLSTTSLIKQKKLEAKEKPIETSSLISSKIQSLEQEIAKLKAS